MKNYIKKISFLAIFALAFWGILTAFQVRTHTEMPSEAAKEKNFERFLSELPKGELPFALSVNQLQKHLEAYRGEQDKRKKSPLQMVRLSYGYSDFLPNMDGGKFSRVPPSASGLMTVPVDDKHLVVYASGRIHAGYQIFYSILYDKKGNVLKEEKLAEIDNNFLMEGAISEDLQIKTITHKIVWSDEENFYDRKIQQLEKGKEAVKTLFKLPKVRKETQIKEVKKAMP